jgi:hypothetical protein
MLKSLQDPSLIKMMCSTCIRHFLLKPQTLPSLNRLKNPIEIGQSCSLQLKGQEDHPKLHKSWSKHLKQPLGVKGLLGIDKGRVQQIL